MLDSQTSTHSSLSKNNEKIYVQESSHPENERLLWDSETQSATIGGLYFAYISNSKGQLSDEEKAIAKANFWKHPIVFKHISQWMGVNRIRITFEIFDTRLRRNNLQAYYLKSYTPRQIAAAMGGHKRLGRDSPLGLLDKELLDFILSQLSSPLGSP